MKESDIVDWVVLAFGAFMFGIATFATVLVLTHDEPVADEVVTE